MEIRKQLSSSVHFHISWATSSIVPNPSLLVSSPDPPCSFFSFQREALISCFILAISQLKLREVVLKHPRHTGSLLPNTANLVTSSFPVVQSTMFSQIGMTNFHHPHSCCKSGRKTVNPCLWECEYTIPIEVPFEVRDYSTTLFQQPD